MNNPEQIPLIELRGLEGNSPTHLSGLQLVVQPHLEILTVIWWCVFFGTLMIVVVKNLVLPILKKR